MFVVILLLTVSKSKVLVNTIDLTIIIGKDLQIQLSGVLLIATISSVMLLLSQFDIGMSIDNLNVRLSFT